MFYRDLISGTMSGYAPAAVRGALRALSWGYRAGTFARNRAFDVGLKHAHRAPVPVISVGNVTAGGTGKTPFVAFLANWFSDRGVRVALLSRGYRALPGRENDEKLVLDRLCPGVPHLQNPDRLASAERACREHGAQVLILDDGFQHRRLARDLDIVLIDALNPWGYGHLLPRGLLREPPSSLRRADIVVLTRADQCPPDVREQIRQQIAAIRGSGECVEVAYPPRMLVNAAGETTDLTSFSGQPVLAFCGLGNPEGFRQTLQREQFAIADFLSFPDHHHYAADDLAELERNAARAGVAGLITTEKDIVKIPRTELNGLPVWAVRIGARVVAGNSVICRELTRILSFSSQS